MKTTKRRKVQLLPISKARMSFGSVIQRAHQNRELFVIEKGGVPMAAVMGLDDLDDFLDMFDEDLKAQIAEGWAEYKRGELKKTGQEFLDELRGELHGERRKRKAA
jgi:hypothetical protein